MSRLIQSLQVLNLPYHGSKTQWKVGDEIDLQGGKNLLLVGGNGTGKSTMLQTLHQSLERAKTVLNGKNLQKENPLIAFADYFSERSYVLRGEYREEQEGMSDDEKSQAYDNEVLSGFEYMLSYVYGGGIENIFHIGFRASYQQVRTVLYSYKEERISGISLERWCRDGNSNAFYNSDVETALLEGAELFATKYGIDLEVIYGNIIALVQNTHGSMNHNAVKWGYINPQGDENKILGARKIVLGTDEPKNESLGYRSKRIVEEIRKASGNIIAILDEPTNGVDRKSIGTHRDGILEVTTNVQIIAASHDEGLITGAEESENWVVYDLDEKNN